MFFIEMNWTMMIVLDDDREGQEEEQEVVDDSVNKRENIQCVGQSDILTVKVLRIHYIDHLNDFTFFRLM